MNYECIRDVLPPSTATSDEQGQELSAGFVASVCVHEQKSHLVTCGERKMVEVMYRHCETGTGN